MAVAVVRERLSSHRVERNGDDIHRVDRSRHSPLVRRRMEPHRLDGPERSNPPIDFRITLVKSRDGRREAAEEGKWMTRLFAPASRDRRAVEWSGFRIGDACGGLPRAFAGHAVPPACALV